jgi:hypothetical protein
MVKLYEVNLSCCKDKQVFSLVSSVNLGREKLN